MSWDLDLLQPLIDALCINNDIILLRVADNVKGVINLTRNDDVMVWWTKSVKYGGVKWCMGNAKSVTLNCGVAGLQT